MFGHPPGKNTVQLMTLCGGHDLVLAPVDDEERGAGVCELVGPGDEVQPPASVLGLSSPCVFGLGAFFASVDDQCRVDDGVDDGGRVDLDAVLGQSEQACCRAGAHTDQGGGFGDGECFTSLLGDAT